MMRRRTLPLLFVFLLPLFGIETNGAAAPAGNEPVRPGVVPGPLLHLPAWIVSVKRFSGDKPVAPAYSGGPLTYEAEIAAPPADPLATNLIVYGLGATALTVPVSAAAGTRTKVKFSDANGLSNYCHPSQFGLRLESSPSSAMKKATVTPHCSFTTEETDPSARLAPVMKKAQRQNTVYYVDPSWSPKPWSCGQDIEAKATVVNGTSSVVETAYLLLAAPTVSYAAAPNPKLDPGASKLVQVTVHQPSMLQASTKFTLELARTTGQTPALHQPGWSVTVNALCSSIDVDL